MYGPPCHVNEHISLQNNKLICAKMTNLMEINDLVFVLHIVSTPSNKLHMVIQG